MSEFIKVPSEDNEYITVQELIDCLLRIPSDAEVQALAVFNKEGGLTKFPVAAVVYNEEYNNIVFTNVKNENIDLKFFWVEKKDEESN